jgi:hypothetical protein
VAALLSLKRKETVKLPLAPAQADSERAAFVDYTACAGYR